MNKIFPRVKTDEEIEALLDEDLSDYLHPDNFKPVTFEFKPKDKSVKVQLSMSLDFAIFRSSTKSRFRSSQSAAKASQQAGFVFFSCTLLTNAQLP